MKKFFTVLSLIFALNAFNVPKSEAGILILVNALGDVRGRVAVGWMLVLLGGPVGAVIDQENESGPIFNALIEKHKDLADDEKLVQSFINKVIIPAYNEQKTDSDETFIQIPEGVTLKFFEDSVIDPETINNLAKKLAEDRYID